MNKLKFKQALLAVVMILLTLVSTLSSCEKNSEVAPTIPPESTFVMDYSMAEQNGGGRSVNAVDPTYVNWGRSAIGVAFWNIALTVTLAVPVASFGESFNHEAVYDASNKDWVWTYTHSVNGNTYEAELHGKYVANDSVQWDMYISKTAGLGQFSGFHWYTGKSNINGLGGNWTLKQSNALDRDFLKIDWTRTADNDVASIKYTQVVEGDAAYGSYIEYGITADTDFDAYYDIYAANADNLINIKWNRTNKNGQIKDPAYYNDENFHCWNTLLQDADCE